MPAAYKPPQTMTFTGCIDSFCNSDLPSEIDNSAYLRNHWAKNELRRWTQLFDKKVDLLETFQEPIHQKFCIVVGRSTSILAPAVFWKAWHLNPSAKFSTLLSNTGQIAANGDESIIYGHH